MNSNYLYLEFMKNPNGRFTRISFCRYCKEWFKRENKQQNGLFCIGCEMKLYNLMNKNYNYKKYSGIYDLWMNLKGGKCFQCNNERWIDKYNGGIVHGSCKFHKVPLYRKSIQIFLLCLNKLKINIPKDLIYMIATFVNPYFCRIFPRCRPFLEIHYKYINPNEHKTTNQSYHFGYYKGWQLLSLYNRWISSGILYDTTRVHVMKYDAKFMKDEKDDRKFIQMKDEKNINSNLLILYFMKFYRK